MSNTRSTAAIRVQNMTHWPSRSPGYAIATHILQDATLDRPARIGSLGAWIQESEGDPDLSTIVLELIRSDNPELKASTEIQLRHEIDLRLDVSETKLRRYKETITELRKRLDEMETMVLYLTT